MFQNTMEDKLNVLRFHIDGVYAQYGKRPTSIIIGVEVWKEFVQYGRDTFVNWNENSVGKYLFGIPVTIDYDRPKHVEVCMGTVINL